MTRRSAIVVRQYKRGKIGVPAVQAWVYRDADGRWRNCETHHKETILSIENEHHQSESTGNSAGDAVERTADLGGVSPSR